MLSKEQGIVNFSEHNIMYETVPSSMLQDSEMTPYLTMVNNSDDDIWRTTIQV